VAQILLTGFEPFGAFATNPSWDALALADEHGLLDGLDAALARIPVTYDGAFATLQAALNHHRPRALLSFGLHGGLAGREAGVIYVETTARNRDGAGKADNAGVTRPARPIDPTAPATLPATLDVPALLEALQAAGFSARTSDDAGAYLCNHLFFRAACALQGQIPCGFVHVPPVKEMGGILTLQELARAAATLARAAAASMRSTQ
jgi:pyroglutamyl-peptidase